MKIRKTITVFGSSIPAAGDEEFETAFRLGELLGRGNFNICCGGYSGIMEAVSRGVTDNGGEATGITLSYVNTKPNKYLTRVTVCSTLFERIEKLISSADAYIVLRGGTGTLLELAAVWEFMNKKLIPLKPVACHSAMWKQIGEVMDRQISKEKRISGIVRYFDNIEEIVPFLDDQLNH